VLWIAVACPGSDKKAKKMDTVGHVQSLLRVCLLYRECEECWFTCCVLVTVYYDLYSVTSQEAPTGVTSLNWSPLKI
jgi:hypothetical protein